MENKKYEREKKERKPVVAICYDFDKTLSPDDMQAQGYIQSVGYDVGEFWTKSNKLAEDNNMDKNLAYMYLMVREAEGKIVVTAQKLAEYGAKVQLFPGVEEWFERIRKYGEKAGVIVEHYIISSGLREMINGTIMARKNVFKAIYASSFMINKKGVPEWPAQVVNFTNKTQFLFRIEKGILDVNDPGVNDFFLPEAVRVPFRNIVYIGDSDTDIPCMKLVNSHGGYSIGVYDPQKKNNMDKVYQMIRDQRIKFFVPADYSEKSELDLLVKGIINRTAANEKLEEIHYQKNNEVRAFDQRDIRDADERIKDQLITKLMGSGSFAYTHLIIDELQQYDSWSEAQRKRLFGAFNQNGQISWIKDDTDVRRFYQGLLEEGDIEDTEAKKVRIALDG